ncbi:MAG TPA: DNA-3-methyladenine glycosylase, partial [Actinomycetota bacterium]|nr:DNA-3-methyladenine glycosylase [Actinomycetota bacterium]
SHGYRGPRPRNLSMFGPPGRLYVYLSYGVHFCANIVCGPEGVSEAVLLRAGEPVAGIEAMRARRGGVRSERLVASGPGRLTQALGIAAEHDGISLLRGGSMWCARDKAGDLFGPAGVLQTRRIGLGRGKGEELPWRFVVAGHPHASRPR